MIIKEYLDYSVSLLKEKRIEDARLNAELILCKVLECDRIHLYLDYEKPLTEGELSSVDEALKRRLMNEPLQYIIGSTQFYGYEFIINDSVLIPRPETELLVEYLLKDVIVSEKKHVSIFEVGAGSGCISVSIAKELELKSVGFEIFSIDKSADAIRVAESNKRLNSIDATGIRFYEKDVFEISRLTRDYDYIVSNPPYVSLKDYDELSPEVRCFEPKDALTDSDEGLSFFDRIFLIASDPAFRGKVFCEIGYGQTQNIEELLKKHGLTRYEFHKDYNLHDRILIASK